MELCRNGNHTFKVISDCRITVIDSSVTRWCSVCGSIVVDREYDGRLIPGDILPLQHPGLYVETSKERE